MEFTTGDTVPWFAASTHTTPQFQFSAAGGRYVVLSFLGSASHPEIQKFLAAIQEQRHQFSDEHCCFFGVTVDPLDFQNGCVIEDLPGIRFFQDFDGAISRAYGALATDSSGVGAGACRPHTLLLDQRLRVLESIPFGVSGREHAERLLGLVRMLPSLGEHHPAEVQAPVLIVPRIFEPELCRRLIQLYEQQGGDESGFMRDINGKTVGVYDYGTKRRQDCIIEDEELRKLCMFRIHDRLAPEIRKAYQFNPTRMERYIVACYQGEQGGHFRAHRDNTTKGTAHRRFAVSLNLNDGYEGGYIWFPEFGRQLFKPPAGGACVFSCSLLHEATPVTSGTRYVFLPFLYDDAAAKIREQNERFLGGDINARPQ